MELKDYREKMDAIDAQLLALFLQRMETAAEIAASIMSVSWVLKRPTA